MVCTKVYKNNYVQVYYIPINIDVAHELLNTTRNHVNFYVHILTKFTILLVLYDLSIDIPI